MPTSRVVAVARAVALAVVAVVAAPRVVAKAVAEVRRFRRSPGLKPHR